MRIALIIVSILLLTNHQISMQKFLENSSDYQSSSNATAPLVTMTSVETVPVMEEGNSHIKSIINETNQGELICGNLAGKGNLGQIQFNTSDSIFLRYHPIEGPDLNLVSKPINGYYEDDPVLPGFEMNVITLSSCHLGIDKIVVTGQVSGHHQFHDTNISTPFRTLSFDLSQFLRFIWIINLTTNESFVTKHLASSIIDLQIDEQGKIYVISRDFDSLNILWWERLVDTLTYELNRDKSREDIAIIELDSNGQLIGYQVISKQLSLGNEPCDLEFMSVSFDKWSSSFHFLGTRWDGCKMVINGEVLNVSYDDNPGGMYYLQYSLDIMNWSGIIFDLITRGFGNQLYHSFGSISANQEEILVTTERANWNFSIIGENYSEDDSGNLIVIRLGKNLTVINTSLVGSSTHWTFPSKAIYVGNNTVLGGAFCTGFHDYCEFTIDGLSVNRTEGWDAFLAVQDSNQNWQHLSNYGAGNFQYIGTLGNYKYPPKSGIHEFPHIIENLENNGFLIVIRFSTSMEIAGTIVPGNQSIIFRFSLDSDMDGISDKSDNCINKYNPEQIDYDRDEIGNECDRDIDGDSIENTIDSCPAGLIDWVSGLLTDFDSDGCEDLYEDFDDDDDGVSDKFDDYPRDPTRWFGASYYTIIVIGIVILLYKFRLKNA